MSASAYQEKNPPTFRSKIRHSVQPVAWISKALWDTQMSSSKPAYLPPFFLQVTLIFAQHYFPIYLIAKTVLVCFLLFHCKYNSATIGLSTFLWAILETKAQSFSISSLWESMFKAPNSCFRMNFWKKLPIVI